MFGIQEQKLKIIFGSFECRKANSMSQKICINIYVTVSNSLVVICTRPKVSNIFKCLSIKAQLCPWTCLSLPWNLQLAYFYMNVITDIFDLGKKDARIYSIRGDVVVGVNGCALASKLLWFV